MLFLYELEVATAQRQQGLGRALIEYLKTICQKSGGMTTWVLTEGENLPAQTLYAAAGGTRFDNQVMFGYKCKDEDLTVKEQPS